MIQKALQYNYVTPKFGYVSDNDLQEAIDGLYQNGEKIISVFPTRYNVEGEMERVLIVTEVEYGE